MNPNNHSPILPTNPDNSSLRAECEELMREALSGTGTENALSQRLSELFVLFPDLKREFEEMQSIAGAMRSHSAPTRSDAEWTGLESRIVKRLEQTTLGTVAAPSTKARLTLLPTRRVWMRIAAIAAVFVGGILLGRWSNYRGEEHRETVRIAENTAFEQAAGQKREVTNFLNDAHLLMLGVMAMNAECGVSHPQALVAQRERCVELMARAQELRHGLSPEEKQHLAHVIVQVESALAELAGTHSSSVNATTIRHLQDRTDDALCEVTTKLAFEKKQ